MKKEVEDALKNIDFAISQIALTREQHVILQNNLELIKKELNPATEPESKK